MKIGILTFHCAINYGAVLQSYGLQEYLRSLGHDVYVIDYRPDYLITPYCSFKFSFDSYSSFIQCIKGFIRACLVFPIRRKRNKAFSKFISKYLKLYKLDFDDKLNDFDAFVFGSDQIWNPQITYGIDKIFIGDFYAAKGKKLIAYAASSGSEKNLSDEEIGNFKYVVNHFEAISVREQSLKEFFMKHFAKEISVVLDPVLLAGYYVFESIAKKEKLLDKPYLLLFQLGHNESVSLYAKKMAQKKQLELVEIISYTNSIKDKNLRQDLSPEEFLAYFKAASYIITTSFHGTVFSILFKKNFNVIRCDKRIDERAFSLLQLLGLESRMCSIDTFMTNSEVNYSLVDEKMHILRQNSVCFLNKGFGEE